MENEVQWKRRNFRVVLKDEKYAKKLDKLMARLIMEHSNLTEWLHAKIDEEIK